MSEPTLILQEKLYFLSKSKLWDHVAQEQNKHLLESEEYDLWLVATESCREEIKKLKSLLKDAIDPSIKELELINKWGNYEARQIAQSEIYRLKSIESKICSP